MENLNIEPSAFTPFVHFNGQSGVLELRGRAIPENPDEFWTPVLKWMHKYAQNPAKKTILKIDMEYFNMSSSKRILILLYQLNTLVKLSKKVQVQWYHRFADEDMYEVGQDYKYMVKIPFEFIGYEEHELKIA